MENKNISIDEFNHKQEQECEKFEIELSKKYGNSFEGVQQQCKEMNAFLKQQVQALQDFQAQERREKNKLNNSVNQQVNVNDNKDVPVLINEPDNIEFGEKNMEKLDLEFYIDADFKTDTYGVCDKNNALAYGKLFSDFANSQFDVEKSAGVKAIWIAKTIKDYLNVKELNLILKTDCQALTWQDGQNKSSYLTKYANKNGINLKVCWIEGETNPADKYTRLKSGNAYGNKKAGNFLFQKFDVEKYCQENKLNNSINQQENINDNKDVPIIDNIDND